MDLEDEVIYCWKCLERPAENTDSYLCDRCQNITVKTEIVEKFYWGQDKGTSIEERLTLVDGSLDSGMGKITVFLSLDKEAFWEDADKIPMVIRQDPNEYEKVLWELMKKHLRTEVGANELGDDRTQD